MVRYNYIQLSLIKWLNIYIEKNTYTFSTTQKIICNIRKMFIKKIRLIRSYATLLKYSHN